MKKLLTTSTALALITITSYAGWFGSGSPSQEVVNLQNQLAEQHNATGFWTIVAGVLALFAIITFITGTILGSKVRKTHGKDTHSREQ